MTDLVEELASFEAHCVDSDQLQVAQLAYDAKVEIDRLRTRLQRAEELVRRNNSMLKSAHIATGKVWERDQLTEDNDAFLGERNG